MTNPQSSRLYSHSYKRSKLSTLSFYPGQFSFVPSKRSMWPHHRAPPHLSAQIRYKSFWSRLCIGGPHRVQRPPVPSFPVITHWRDSGAVVAVPHLRHHGPWPRSENWRPSLDPRELGSQDEALAVSPIRVGAHLLAPHAPLAPSCRPAPNVPRSVGTSGGSAWCATPPSRQEGRKTLLASCPTRRTLP